MRYKDPESFGDWGGGLCATPAAQWARVLSLICGILSRNNPEFASAEALEATLAATRHRANDGQATFVDAPQGIALAYGHAATFGNRKDVLSWHEDENVVAGVDG